MCVGSIIILSNPDMFIYRGYRPGLPTSFLPTRNLCNDSTFAYLYRISNSSKYFKIIIYNNYAISKSAMIV